MSWIAGCDYSTKNVDVVLVDEDDERPPEWHRYPLVGQDAFDRARAVRDSMYAPQFDWMDVVAVGVEDPRGYGAGALYRVQGAVLAHIPHEILVHPLIPSQWRKLVGLPGNASKQDVAAGAVARGAPAEWITSDSYDGYMIALATRVLLERSHQESPDGTRAA